MNKFEDIRGVAFDLDGTLVDSAPGLAAAVDMALYALELPVAGEERVITWIGNGADVLMERALTWARQERATLRKTMGKPPVDDDIPAEEQVRILRKLFDRYYGEVAEEGTFLFPHVADTLGALQAKGLPLGLVTNKPTPFVAPLLEALDIAKYFSVVIGGDDVQNKKPHPDPLLLVAERMGIAPQQMLFVGDSRNDIQAAKIFRLAMTSTVGKIRTSTGSIRVIKIIQKKRLRSGKRNQTMANAESIETVILPSVMLNAITKLLSNIRQNGALFVPTPFTQMLWMF